MKKILITLLSIILTTNSALASNNLETKQNNIPRMASLRSNLANARSGPGAKYPIEWVYKQKNAPIEIIGEFDLWRKIKDWEGSQSWIHTAILSNARWIKMTKLGTSNIYAKPQKSAKLVAKVEDGVIGKIIECPKASDFCLIEFEDIKGWVNKNNFFGVYEDEVIEK